MSIENKLAIYEFEVEENEPKVKQKERRIRKVGEKNKSKKEQNRIVPKNVAASLQHSKKVPFVRLVKFEDAKNATPPKKKSTVATPGISQISDEEMGNSHKVKSVVKADFSPVSDDEEMGNSHKLKSVPKPGFSPMSDDEDMGTSYEDLYDRIFFSDEKRSTISNSSYMENHFLWLFEEPEGFEEPEISPIKNPAEGVTNQGEIVPTPHRFYQKQDGNCEKKEEIPMTQVTQVEVDENEPKVKQKKRRIRKVGEKNKSKKEQNRIVTKNVAASLPHSKKVPFVRLVRFEDTKNATPAKKNSTVVKRGISPMTAEEMGNSHKVKSVVKADFSPVSDDEEMGNSHKLKSVPKPGFSPMSDDEDMGTSYEDLYDRIFSSDEKRSTISNSSYMENHFLWLFEEPEGFEEPEISPIKNPAEGVSNQGEIVPTPHRFYQKQDGNCEKKEEVPVAQVIKMLKNSIGNDEQNLEITSRSFSNSVSPIFNEPAAEDYKTNITIKQKKMERSVKHRPQRSYERPSYLRKINKTFEEHDSGRESYEDKKKKTFLPKKKHGKKEKEKEEMQTWINAFNSHCQEIEKYNLVVE